jgi:hypothetical protein
MENQEVYRSYEFNLITFFKDRYTKKDLEELDKQLDEEVAYLLGLGVPQNLKGIAQYNHRNFVKRKHILGENENLRFGIKKFN